MPILKYIALSVLMAVFSGFNSVAKAETTKEDRVKAAIIYKVTKFISWPKKRQALSLCVVGSGSINKEISKINRKSSMGRRLSVTHKAARASLDKFCDLVFIHNSNNKDIDLVINKLKNHPILTISDNEQFAKQGGIIELYRSGSRIRFAINKGAAQNSNLSIDAQLLKLAKVIE